MKTSDQASQGHRLNDWLFVLISTSAFLLVMIMSSTPAGFRGFEKNFFKKGLLIQTFNHLRMKIGDRVFNHVLIGKDGWMEYTGERNLDDYQNVLNLSSETLDVIATNIQSCYQYAQERHMTFLIVVVPNKASIYPDKLPEQIEPLSNVSRVTQLNTYLRAHNIPEVLDLRSALNQARKQREVYYKTDTHWNGYGAYAAYTEIINHLAKRYPDLSPYPSKFFRFRENKAPYGVHDLASQIEANFIREPNIIASRNFDDFVSTLTFPDFQGYHEVSWMPNSNLPILLLFHDSFGFTYLKDLLALHFSKAFYIYRNASALYLNRRAIEQFSPDIIIYEVVERYLYLIQNDLSGCTAK